MSTKRAVEHLANAVADLTAAVVALRDKDSPVQGGLLGAYMGSPAQELNDRLDRTLTGIKKALQELDRNDPDPHGRR